MSDASASGVAWLAQLSGTLASEGLAVLVVVAGAQGSAPRETGAAMVVGRERCAGSVGGGHLEFEAIRIAREALTDERASGTWIVRYPLAARLGQCCGGVATLAFSRIRREASGWIEAAQACARTGAPFALIARIGGNADGCRLVVTTDDVRGTCGDAAVDSAAIALARTRLATGTTGATLVRAAGEDAASLLLQVARPDAFPVLIFGNGHVGRALVKVLSVVDATASWIDSRTGDFPALLPDNVKAVITDAPQDELADAPAGAFIVIATHSHALDFTLVETALSRDDWRYLGLIGSKSKRAQFERRLAARGFGSEAMARIHCPIGTAGVAIRGKHPGSIAIAIAAEMLAVRETAARLSSPHLGVTASRGQRH